MIASNEDKNTRVLRDQKDHAGRSKHGQMEWREEERGHTGKVYYVASFNKLVGHLFIAALLMFS